MQNIIEQIKNSGVSLNVIADKSGIEFYRISSIINGEQEPTLSELRKISKAIKIAPDFFFSDRIKKEEIGVLFRKTFNSERQKIEADRISYLISNAFFLLDDYSYKNSSLAQFSVLENSFVNARILAAKFREVFCNSDFFIPLINLPQIITERLNCILFISDLGNNVDGASAIIKNIPFIFIAPRFESRMLFTLAHELGHILSHHNKNSDFVNVDNNITVNGRNKNKDEAFANAFASEVLMPEEGIGVTLQSIRKFYKNSGAVGDIEIIYLSRIYGVSFDVAAKRCEDLNLLPYGGAISLSEQIKKLYGSAEKRAAELNIREREKILFPKVSPILLNLALKKINSEEISIGKASEILSISVSDLIDLNRKN